MCSDPFVHLHNHSEYSALDGMPSPEDMVKRAVELGQPGIAITDHGNMHGVVEFVRAAKEHDIVPIIGFEGYLCRFGTTMLDKNSANRENRHILTLAENHEGYQNLIKLSSMAYLEGFYGKPRYDYDALQQYKSGLIVTSGCMASETCRMIQDGASQSQLDMITDWYVQTFGKENYYIELQHHPGIPELVGINKTLIDLAYRHNLKMVATNDAHYVKPGDAKAHDVLLCVQTRSYIDQYNRMRFTDEDYYIKSRAEMESMFLQYPNVGKSIFDNTLEIMERCKGIDVESKEKHHMPSIDILPIYQDYDDALYQTGKEGLTQILGAGWENVYPEYKERFEHEHQIIKDTGYAVYYLIINDICEFARQENIIWNVRGSGTGSLFSYALGMSFVDPIKYRLLFERFINPHRVSMPDFDMDFPDDSRERIINYLIGKYGYDNVAQIVTFGRMKARMCIRDVTRVHGWEQVDIDKLAGKILNTPGKPITIENSLDKDSEYYSSYFDSAYNKSPHVKAVVDIAKQLEKTVRHTGVHAAAIAISDRPLVEYVPLMRGSKSTTTDYITQYDYPTLESLGLLKVDILGLATLSIVRKTCELIKEKHGIDINYFDIPFDSPDAEPAYSLLRSGEVKGVFQVESHGLRKILVDLQPTTFQQIMDVISLYRPGPLDYIPQYIARTYGQEEVSYPHEDIAHLLEYTQGIIIYQEQIIKILTEMGGFSPGEADLVRKSISKKDVEKIAKEREHFIKRATENGYTYDEAAHVFDDIAKFALYGFNLAHAASYARMTVVTAWLKAVYPAEFITACLIAESQKPEKVTGYILEAKRMGIEVLPPNVNQPSMNFVLAENKDYLYTDRYAKYPYPIRDGSVIHFGFGSIKQLGENAAQQLISGLDGTYDDVNDILRLDFELLNTRSLKRLISAGVFDDLAKRSYLFGNEETIISYGKNARDVYVMGQKSLLPPTLPTLHSDDTFDLCQEEYESLGVWLTKHPLEEYYKRLDSILTCNIYDLQSEDLFLADNKVTMIFVVDAIKNITTKKGDPMCFLQLSDPYGTIEGVVFPSAYEQVSELIEEGKIALITGKIDMRRDSATVIVDKVYKNIEIAN